MKTIQNISLFSIVLLLMVLPNIVHAQAGFNEDVADTPIDGGLSLLVAAGVGYGAKKLKAAKQDAQK